MSPTPSLKPPRVAFCTDTFEEANGVATVSRAFAEYAKRHQLPFLLVRPGVQSRTYQDGAMTVVEVAKSPLSLPLDMGLRFDLLVFRQAPWLREQMNAFHPDIVHITGPGDLGMLCARLSHTLRTPKPPLVAAWHTNIHQYARMRAANLLRLFPSALGQKLEDLSFLGAARFYKTARLILAPNQEMVDQLARRTGKTARLMLHGVDADLFSPPVHKKPSGIVTLGYAGRLTSEKNVRFLADIAGHLTGQFRLLIVGDGVHRTWLAQHLPRDTEFTGVLRGQPLAAAYKEMDIFLFPSKSDTFGLVQLEAMASGIPVVSFQVNGPKSVVENGVNGFTAASEQAFISGVQELLGNAQLRESLGVAAAGKARKHNWDNVFDRVYEAYGELSTLIPIGILDIQKGIV